VKLVQSRAYAFAVLSLLAASCQAQSDSKTVVDRFVRLYFTEDE
jgi:hypothetical protein